MADPRDNPKNRLVAISEILLRVHKGLLQFQKDLHEKAEGKRFTPHEVLNLSFTHPNFQWLRSLSKMIVQIDTAVDDKKSDLPALETEVRKELGNLFTGENSPIKDQLAGTLSVDPEFALALSELKKFL